MDAVVRLSGGGAVRKPAVSPVAAPSDAVSSAPADPPRRERSPKSGVVLAYRPRDAARRIAPKTAVAPAQQPRPAEPCVIIHFAGHEYVTRESMADLFLRSAGRVVVDGDSQSVPLLHEDGVDLLFITPTASVRVTRMPEDS